jgi:hypothetical protein
LVMQVKLLCANPIASPIHVFGLSTSSLNINYPSPSTCTGSKRMERGNLCKVLTS